MCKYWGCIENEVKGIKLLMANLSKRKYTRLIVKSHGIVGMMKKGPQKGQDQVALDAPKWELWVWLFVQNLSGQSC